MKKSSVFAVLAAAAIFAPVARADEPAKPADAAAKPADAAKPAAGAPAAAPNEKEMMEKYMKAATPGPEHAELAKMAGKWNLEVSMFMAPGAPAQKSKATATYTSVMGGRFLQQEVKGDMNGQPFEGMGLEGYDNVTKQYFASWVDNMGTGAMMTKGKCANKKCTMHGKVPDAVAGKEVNIQETITQTDDNHFTFVMWGPGPDGKLFKTLEIAYTRAP